MNDRQILIQPYYSQQKTRLELNYMQFVVCSLSCPFCPFAVFSDPSLLLFSLRKNKIEE